ncbi:SGNH/GDSL hydrolase family protein [Trujillonella endophytica]|uniref:SGNH/GDSL hydrolase family protein n=1 Tax=Trujillonella endophytica TaxID=673521 RepID=UPI00147F8F27|nr:SGNH/GDSL hydrolase family protein [Trujillella endophytica]
MAGLVLGGCQSAPVAEGLATRGQWGDAATQSPAGTLAQAVTAVPAAPAVPAGRSFVVVGDSLTAGGAPIRGPEADGEFSWVPAALGPGVEFRGGWATDGANAAQMRAGVTPADADVLVVMAGTNDMLQGRPWAQTRDDLIVIAARAGTPVVLLSAVPPNDVDPAGALALNRSLAGLAAEQGWAFADPWEPVTVGGRYRAGSTLDGVHPTPRVAAEVGTRLRAALLQVRAEPPR